MNLALRQPLPTYVTVCRNQYNSFDYKSTTDCEISRRARAHHTMSSFDEKIETEIIITISNAVYQQISFSSVFYCYVCTATAADLSVFVCVSHESEFTQYST